MKTPEVTKKEYTATFRFSDDNSYGSYTIPIKNKLSFYNSAMKHYFSKERIHYEDICKTFCRLLHFMDKNNFVLSYQWSVPNLNHKRPQECGVRPSGFDHTFGFRRPGERWPILITTEPYKAAHESHVEEGVEKIWNQMKENYGVQYKIFDSFEKGLWNVPYCYLITWWNSTYFDFEKEFQLPDSWESVKKDLIINKTERKKKNENPKLQANG